MRGLTTRAVSKSYGSTRALDSVDLHVPEGSVTSLVGPSGCGKTTLLRIVAGFIAPDAGEVELEGVIVSGQERDVRTQDRHVGFVPQQGALFPHLDVATNISFGLPRGAARGSRVRELLDLVELPRDFTGRYPHELSGGQQQRVAVARALAPSPSILLLDEPFSSLDAALRGSTGRSVMRAVRASGATALLVTHDQEEALSLSDHVAVMRSGRVRQVGSPAEVYTAPQGPWVGTFVGNGTVLPAVVTAGRAECELGSVATNGAPDGDAVIFLRPEQVVSLGHAPDGALVEDVAYHGHHATVRLRLRPDGPVVVSTMPARVMPLVGDRLRLTVSGNALVFAPRDIES